MVNLSSVGFRNNASMVAAITASQFIDALPTSVKFFLTAVFAALGNLVVELIRVKYTEAMIRRRTLEKELEAQK